MNDAEVKALTMLQGVDVVPTLLAKTLSFSDGRGMGMFRDSVALMARPNAFHRRKNEGVDAM